MTGAEITEMYRLLAIAKYDERYVVPTAAAIDSSRGRSSVTSRM